MSDFFLADDLSGALDAAAAFHHAGRRVRLPLSFTAWTAGDDPDEVVGFSTESRNAPPVAAAALVLRAIAHGSELGGQLLYKKIDSTLRGPVAAEMAALAQALPEARILFTPANPAVGRTVRNGVLLVRGVPVGETEFARDPASPVTESVVARHLGLAAGAPVTIADVETEADLAAAVTRMTAAGGPWIAVGSGALARPVAANWNRRDRAAVSARTTAGSPWRQEIFGRAAEGEGMLLVCGSAHPANRVQAARLARERGVAIVEVALTGDLAPVAQTAATHMRTTGAVAFMLESRKAGDAAASECVLARITAAAVAVIEATRAARLFITGGETARAVCLALGVGALEFRAEVEPGLAIADGQGSAGWLRLAVKPGGFGDEATWVRAFDRLRGAAG